MSGSCKKGLACVAAVLSYAVSCTSYSADWPRALLRSSFQEDLREKVPLSGGLLVGVTVPVVSKSETNRRVPPILIFAPPSMATRDTCVTVRSRDGRYRAENTYELPANAKGGFAQLDFPTQHPQILGEFGKEDVAVLAVSGACESKGPDLVLPAAWGDPAQTAVPTLILAVNGGRKKVTAEIVDAAMAPEKCKRIGKAHTKAFDTTCELQVSAQLGDEVRVKLTEFRLGSKPIGSSIHRIGIQP